MKKPKYYKITNFRKPETPEWMKKFPVGEYVTTRTGKICYRVIRRHRAHTRLQWPENNRPDRNFLIHTDYVTIQDRYRTLIITKNNADRYSLVDEI